MVPEFLVCLTRCCLPGAGRKQSQVPRDYIQPRPLPSQQLGSLTLQFPAPSLHHPLNCHPPHCPHPSSLLGCVHTVLPTEPASLLFSFNQILPILPDGRSMSSMMVSTGPQSPGFHSLSVSCHHVLSHHVLP